jgi:hypothetical protein
MDAKFLRSTYPVIWRLVAKSALCGGISSDPLHYQHIEQFGTAAIGIGFHFFLH